MDLDANFLERNQEFQAYPTPGHGYKLPPLEQTRIYSLPSAPPYPLEHSILPPIRHEKFDPIPPAAAPDRVTYITPVPDHADLGAVSSARRWWPAVAIIIITSLIIGSIIAIIVTTNKQAQPGCSRGQFYCNSGSAKGYCIPDSWLCNDFRDCFGGEDERNCAVSSASTCSYNEYACERGGKHGKCIPITWLCDGFDDCADATDEANCSSQVSTCSDNQYTCVNGGIYGECIPAFWLCDGYDDCNNATDEADCDFTASSCPDNQHTCKLGGGCIPTSRLCDGINDCNFGTDEANCSVTCGLTEFLCENAHGACLPAIYQCDGISHCDNGADELNCSDTYACPNPSGGYFRRIPKAKVCDGVEDCPGGIDEDRCIISPSGSSGSPMLFSVDTLSHHPFCASGWTTAKSDSVCVFMGFSSSSRTATVYEVSEGIYWNGSYSNISELVQTTPSRCLNDEVIELTCSSEIVCGLTSKISRVVGGEDAEIANHPWQVSLQQGPNGIFWSHFCGGTIVSKKWVLTAAHCISDVSPPTYQYYRVVAGVSRLSHSIQDNNRYGLANVIAHPLHDSTSLVMDFALVQVSPDFLLSTTIQPVCIPASGQLFDDLSSMTVSGWGDTSEGGTALDILQVATVPFYKTDTCSETFASLSHLILDGMVCAGFENGGVDTCHGDSGGPLVADVSGTKYLAGVTSWGIGCARPNRPGVYADVSFAGDWIRRKRLEYEV